MRVRVRVCVCVCVCVCVTWSMCLTPLTPGTVAHQAPLSLGFSRQEYQSCWPFPSPRDLPSPGIEFRSPSLMADTLPSEKFSWDLIKKIMQFKKSFKSLSFHREDDMAGGDCWDAPSGQSRAWPCLTQRRSSLPALPVCCWGFFFPYHLLLYPSEVPLWILRPVQALRLAPRGPLW